MTQFVIILQDGSLYKNVFVKTGRFFAQNNSDIYWYLKENESIEIFTSKNNKYLTKDDLKTINESNVLKTMNSKSILKNQIYYFTTSQNYKH